ncbi:GH23131 [Drosophila grimshawi]|uniref:GH23131 n=1 Tax=Drosophila grimshawi TaxID=7222 RepID=B4JVJ2_DROGR|nr:GH23131 [Drosophila grimshawi]
MWHPPGLNLPVILNTLSSRVEELLDVERAGGNLGGRSLVALLVPSPTSFVDERDYDYCVRYMHRMRHSLPNLHIIYYGGGALVRFHDFVREPSRDLLLLNIGKPPEKCGLPVVRRIRQVPRRLWNPRCSSNGAIGEYGSDSLEQYARLGNINFYRLDALYMAGRRSMRYLKITPISQITFAVCFSRSHELPFRNGSLPLRQDETCESTAPQGSYSYDLTDACVGYDFEPCPPLFFSVQAQGFGHISCDQPACQTPDEAQYFITLTNLGCNRSAALHLTGALILLNALCSILSLSI